MAVSLQNIYTRIQPFLLRKLDTKDLKWITDSELIELANSVQEDVNIQAYANMERFYQLTDGTNIIELSGEVLEIINFKYRGDFRINSTQRWCLALNVSANTYTTIVFKSTPSAGIRVEIDYLRKALPLALVTDTVDLPSQLEQDFMELLRRKILTVFGDADPQLYEQDLQMRFTKVNVRTRNRFFGSGAKSSMSGFVTDDFDYDFIEFEVGDENVVADVNGDYTWVGQE